MTFVLIGIVGPQRTNDNVHVHVVRKSSLQVPGHCLVGPSMAAFKDDCFRPVLRCFLSCYPQHASALESNRMRLAGKMTNQSLHRMRLAMHRKFKKNRRAASVGAKISSIQVLLDFIHSIRDFDSSSIMAFGKYPPPNKK